MQIYNSRSEVPEKYKWDLTEFCKDEEEFEVKYKLALELADKLPSYQGCTKDASKLKEFLDLNVKAVGIFEELYAYAHLTNDQELGISANSDRFGKVLNLQTKINVNTCFFAPELLTLEKDQFVSMFDQDADLRLYQADLEKIYREKDYILSEEEEKIVSDLEGANANYSEISSTLLNALHDYGKITVEDGSNETITLTNYGKLMKKASREKREEIYKSFFKIIDQYGQTNASLLNSFVKKTNVIAQIHHFKDAWEHKLFELNISNKVYTSLVDACEKNLEPLQRFYKLKAKCLGVDELHSWDLPLDLVECNKEYSIEDAQALILEAIKPLGDDYGKRFKRIFDERFVDYCQYKGKQSGGYSLSIMNHTSRILMSYNGDLDSVSTLAHEGGHNVNHQYICENNPSIYSDTTLLVAEVSSLTNECLLSSYLALHGETKEEKMAGIANFLEIFIGNFYSAIRECKMEQDMYDHVNAGGILSKDYLNDLNRKSLEKYENGSIVMDEYRPLRWIMRSHYYTEFYLYSYAICISIASHVASRILDDDQNMLDNYIKFLGCGLDKWPMDIFKVLGVDLENADVYNSAIKYFETMMDKFESLSKED